MQCRMESVDVEWNPPCPDFYPGAPSSSWRHGPDARPVSVSTVEPFGLKFRLAVMGNTGVRPGVSRALCRTPERCFEALPRKVLAGCFQPGYSPQQLVQLAEAGF